MVTTIPFVPSPSGNKSLIIYVLKAQHDNDETRVAWCGNRELHRSRPVCSISRKQCCIMLSCFAAPTGSCCSAACNQASSGFTRCSMKTAASSLCVHTGLSVSMTTNTDTWSTFVVATMTGLCWVQVMMETSFPSVYFLQRGDRETYRRRWLWSPYPGSACMHHHPFQIYQHTQGRHKETKLHLLSQLCKSWETQTQDCGEFQQQYLGSAAAKLNSPQLWLWHDESGDMSPIQGSLGQAPQASRDTTQK